MDHDSDPSLAWRVSSACNTMSCVAVARLDDGRIALRDTKDPSLGSHVFDATEWGAFIAGVKAGEFDYSS